MSRSGSLRSILPLVGGVALVAAGVASNIVFDSPFRLVPALVFVTVGVAGVTSTAREYRVARLRRTAKRWWLLAVAAFLPYALVAAPESEAAAAVGDALAGPLAAVALEAVAGATVLCAASMSVLYGFAWYGIHPGRPTPEERVLTDGTDD